MAAVASVDASAILSHLSHRPWKAVGVLLSERRLWVNGFVCDISNGD